MFSAAQRSRIDAANKALIEDARGFLDKHPIHKEGKDIGTTALRNVLDAALAASCLEEVQAFVEYQIGRDAKKWLQAGFGTGLLGRLGPEGVARTQAARLAGGFPAEQQDDLALEVAVRWLGFLYRYYRYSDALERERRKGQGPGGRP